MRWTGRAATGLLECAIGALVLLQVLGGGWVVTRLSEPASSTSARFDPVPADGAAIPPPLPPPPMSELPAPAPTATPAVEPAPPPPPKLPVPLPQEQPTLSQSRQPRAAVDVRPLGDLLRGLLPAVASHPVL